MVLINFLQNLQVYSTHKFNFYIVAFTEQTNSSTFPWHKSTTLLYQEKHIV